MVLEVCLACPHEKVELPELSRYLAQLYGKASGCLRRNSPGLEACWPGCRLRWQWCHQGEANCAAGSLRASFNPKLLQSHSFSSFYLNRQWLPNPEALYSLLPSFFFPLK